MLANHIEFGRYDIMIRDEVRIIKTRLRVWIRIRMNIQAMNYVSSYIFPGIQFQDFSVLRALLMVCNFIVSTVSLCMR